MLHHVRSNAHSQTGQVLPDFDPPSSFQRYVSYYMQQAHSGGMGIDMKSVPVAVRMVCAFYGRYDAPLLEDDYIALL